MVKHHVEGVVNILWVFYYKIQFLMKTKSRNLLLIKSKFTANYRNFIWTNPWFTSQYMHRYFSCVIHAASQKDIVDIEKFSWCIVRKHFCWLFFNKRIFILNKESNACFILWIKSIFWMAYFSVHAFFLCFRLYISYCAHFLLHLLIQHSHSSGKFPSHLGPFHTPIYPNKPL